MQESRKQACLKKKLAKIAKEAVQVQNEQDYAAGTDYSFENFRKGKAINIINKNQTEKKKYRKERQNQKKNIILPLNYVL